MDYAESRRLLDTLPRFEVKPGLARIERLLARLGRPELGFPAIHVTGTNGKGSVVAMLAGVLQSAGYRVGRYTSPDVVDFLDRICVDGRWIAPEDFASIVGRLAPEFDTAADVPSQFEALTAVAFEHFRNAAVDVAVVEVGLGGRFDATNVVTPILTILTTVALDHTALLGRSETQIAWEKAGIAKPSVPMLVGRLTSDVGDVVRRECAAVGAPLLSCDLALSCRGRKRGSRIYDISADEFPRRIHLPLLGAYQDENLRLVLAAVRALRDRGWAIPADAVESGLTSVSWPGRWEVLRTSPTVILDGAHNPHAAAAAARAIEEWEPLRERRALLLGVLADKDVDGIVGALVPLFPIVGVAASSSPRALSSEDLAAHVERYAEQWIRYDSIEEGVRDLIGRVDRRGTILVTGSLTVVAEARRIRGGG